MTAPKAPRGLKADGSRLWREMTTGYDFTDCPERLRTLEMACRSRDLIVALQAAVDGLKSYRVKGSAGGEVAAPELQALARERNLYLSLTRALRMEEADIEGRDGPMDRRTSAIIAANARWARRSG